MNHQIWILSSFFILVYSSIWSLNINATAIATHGFSLSSLPWMNPSPQLLKTRQLTNMTDLWYGQLKQNENNVYEAIVQSYPELKNEKYYKTIMQKGNNQTLYQVKVQRYLFVLQNYSKIRVISFPMLYNSYYYTQKLFEMNAPRQIPMYYTTSPAVVGFKPYVNYQNSSFLLALNQTWQQQFHLEAAGYFLKAEFLASSEFYYFRLFFVTEWTATKQYDTIACVLPYNMITSRRSYIPKPQTYAASLKYLLATMPELANFRLVRVTAESILSTTYIFLMENSKPSANISNHFQQLAYKVMLTLTQTYTVSLQWKNTAYNYGVRVIEKLDEIAKKKWQELKDMKLVEISNLNQEPEGYYLDRQGLKLIYRNSSANTTVSFYLQNGEQIMTIH